MGRLGERLSGVSVQVKGTTAATLTREDGSFEIQAPANSTVIISFVGHTPREVKVANSNIDNLSIQLTENRWWWLDMERGKGPM